MWDEHTEYEVTPYDVKNDKTKTNFIVLNLSYTPFPHPPSLKKQKQKHEIHLALLRMKKWKEWKLRVILLGMRASCQQC